MNIQTGETGSLQPLIMSYAPALKPISTGGDVYVYARTCVRVSFHCFYEGGRSSMLCKADNYFDCGILAISQLVGLRLPVVFPGDQTLKVQSVKMF